MPRRTLRSADPTRGWDCLRFPPPWWELPVLVAVLSAITWFAGSRSYLVAIEGGGIGALLFIWRYSDGERALLHRLETRLLEMQEQLDRLKGP